MRVVRALMCLFGKNEGIHELVSMAIYIYFDIDIAGFRLHRVGADGRYTAGN